MNSMPEALITGLYIYPVKSLRGVHLNSAELTPNGLKNDRRWMIINENGRALTQRQLPAMALITPELSTSGLRLSAEHMGGIDIPTPGPDAESCSAFLWQDSCEAKLANKQAHQWLGEVLQYKHTMRLVYFGSHRVMANTERFGRGTTNHFADASPYLIANALSLTRLNEQLVAQKSPPADIRQFRPNIVFSGLPSFTEHNVSLIKLNNSDIQFSLVDHCQRCSMITVNPDSGSTHRDATPFKQLAELNSMPNSPKAPAFGVNSVLKQGEGKIIRVGDSITFDPKC